MLAAGMRLGPYEILAPLGRGGMGEVYRARDHRLERDVAVKIVPEQMAKDVERLRRFEREAKAVAALEHPNILVIHDVGREQGIPFAVTELLEGVTLRDMLQPTTAARDVPRAKRGRGRKKAQPREDQEGRRLGWREAFEIGTLVTDGLAAAHAKGIIHRDLKPENLFLTSDGRVKILDFGLARLEMPASSDVETATFVRAATKSGVIVGTIGYMSPEQLRGQAVDARSDLFSLGCVLYELVAGRRPFQRPTAADTTAAILHDDPPPLSSYSIAVPAEAEELLRRCLAKKRAHRFASARALADALRAVLNRPDSTAELFGAGLPTPTEGLRPSTRSPRTRRPSVKPVGGVGRPAPNKGAAAASTAEARRAPPRKRGDGIRSLAVLPLVNSTVDPEAEYLSDGITESIIQSLSQLPELRVTARSIVFRYKGQDIDAQEIGRALKVRAVLTGLLLKRGARLVLKTELVDVRSGARLWGETYDRAADKVQTLETVVAQDIAHKLRLRLSQDEQRRLSRAPTDNVEAYQGYLTGRYYWNKRTGEGLKKSVKLFEEAIDKDPMYALAYAGLADAYLNLGGWGYLASREAYPRAKAAAQQALAIDANLAEAYASLGMALKEYEWDWQGAGKAYERALELQPSYAIAHQWYGEYLATLGRHDQAIAEMRRALELEPLSLIMHATLGHGYYFARRYDESIIQLKKTLEMDENFWVAHHFLGITYAQVGRLDEAGAEVAAAEALTDNLELVAIRGYVHALAGRRAQAEQVLAELDERARRGHVSAMLRAIIAIGLRDRERAFVWLEQAYQERSQILSEAKVEAIFDPLRTDRRWADLLPRLGLGA
jgi:serine/threonine protein kinase/tetratricopeptide (TPR) repeat protein